MPVFETGGREFESLRAGQNADVAQLVEQRIENPCVTGSNPVFGTKQLGIRQVGLRHRILIPAFLGSNPRSPANADVEQWEFRFLGKKEVVGSIPTISTKDFNVRANAGNRGSSGHTPNASRSVSV